MRRILVLLAVLAMLILSACGNASPDVQNDTQQTTVTTAATTEPVILTDEEHYAVFLSNLRETLSDIVVDDTYLDGFDREEGMVGVAEMASVHKINMMSKIGYNICDINNDGVLELFICEVDELSEGSCNGSRILCAYTVADNKMVLLFEGTSRNCYYILEDNTIFNKASNEAGHTGYGVFALNGNTHALDCVDFYFSDTDNNGAPLFLHNTTGQWDKSVSTAFEGNEDAFLAKVSAFSDNVQSIDLTVLGANDN